MTHRERFKELYFSLIKREGEDKLYDYLTSTGDFLTAPASTRFHLSYEGGLLEHSLNVYDCLNDYLNRARVKETYGMEYSPETIAIVSLLHDVCKVGCYKKGSTSI